MFVITSKWHPFIVRFCGNTSECYVWTIASWMNISSPKRWLFMKHKKYYFSIFLKLFTKNNELLMHQHLSNFGNIQSLKFLTAFAYPHIFKRLLNLVSSWTDFTWFYTKRIVVSNFHREYRLNVGILSLVQRLGYVYLQRYAQEILVT